VELIDACFAGRVGKTVAKGAAASARPQHHYFVIGDVQKLAESVGEGAAD
jgi:hypothetical protein